MSEPTFSTTEHCRAHKDGDCFWEGCPQLRDNEPHATGRHCPYDHFCYLCGEDEKLGPQPHLC
jgi:hypothetical protein